MVSKEEIDRVIDGYDKSDLTVATICSHSSLQIFHGAKQEGLKTLGICLGKPPRHYDAFPLARPDEFLCLDNYLDLLDMTDELLSKNVVVVPHGSFVQYMRPENFIKMGIPTFGNRDVLEWESDRSKEREWLTSAGLTMPALIEQPEDINRPVLVKYDGARGGRGFFIAKDVNDFKMGIEFDQKYTIQEYILGTRYYLHYFYSPIGTGGFNLSKGNLELLSMDRRDESNIDEMYKLGSQEELKKHRIYPSFVVTGNIPVVIRESLLPKVFEMGEAVVERSLDLFGGMMGPFCLETIVTDKLEFVVFEISSRIVAGTNPFITGSPYSDFVSPNLSTGRRIAQEIKQAAEKDQLKEIFS